MTTHENITHYHFFKRLCSVPKIEAIYLYGSRARGQTDEWADIDLAISVPTMTESEWLGVKEIVATPDTLLPIDITWLDQTPEGVFKREIERDGVVLHQRRYA